MFICIHLYTYEPDHRGLGPMQVCMDFWGGAFNIWLLKIQQPCVSQDTHLKHNLGSKNWPFTSLQESVVRQIRDVTGHLNFRHSPRIT